MPRVSFLPVFICRQNTNILLYCLVIVYSCTLSVINILIILFFPCVAIPGPPSRPEVLDVTHEGMTLTWQPPEDNGGSTISGYLIERKEAHSDRWMRINKNPVTMTRYRSSGLIEGVEYEHRITAINSRGAGKPSESSAITVAMDPIGM